MKAYIIDSIELKSCSKSDVKTLNRLKICNNCKKLPIPAYRSFKNQDLTFCRSCYYTLNYKEKHLLKSTDIELELLGELILSCKNPECSKEFDLNSMEEMIVHEITCLKEEDSLKLKNCKRCLQFYSNYKKHDCITELQKEHGISNQILKKYIQEQISHQNDLFNKRINELEEKFLSQEQTITKLTKKLNKVEKSNKFYENLLRENKKIIRDDKDKLNQFKEKLEKQECLQNTKNKVILKKLFETEKNLYFDKLVKLFNHVREGSLINPVLENQIINGSFNLKLFKFKYLHNNEFIKFEEGEVYNIEDLYNLFNLKSDFLCYKDVLIYQEEMYKVYEIDLIKGINKEFLRERISELSNFFLYGYAKNINAKDLIDEFQNECGKLPIPINIERNKIYNFESNEKKLF